MDAPPPRIASVVPSLTELLFSLDLGDQVVARTGFCVHPHGAVRRVPKVGGTKDVDIDALLATKPSHLVVNIDENRKDTITRLSSLVPEIVVTHPLVPDDNLILYREFGRLFDRARQADALSDSFLRERRALSATIEGTAPLNVLYLIWKDPWFTVSSDTYVSAMLGLANLRTVPASGTARYPILTDEDPAWLEADFILLSSEPYSFREKHAVQLRRKLAPKPVLLVDGELLGWYGSRAIEGLRYLRELRSRVDRA